MKGRDRRSIGVSALDAGGVSNDELGDRSSTAPASTLAAGHARNESRNHNALEFRSPRPKIAPMLATLTALAYSHAQRIVALAVQSTMDDINGILDAKSSLLSQPRMPPTVTLPRPGGGAVHAKDYVEALISLVHDAPWATRSRELRAILGVKKDPFLRIASAALATGRIVRTGYKASVTYLPAKDGRPLDVAKIRMEAGARPRSKQSMNAFNAQRRRAR